MTSDDPPLTLEDVARWPLILTARHLCNLFHISKRTLHEWWQSENLPHPRKLNPRARNSRLVWYKPEVLAFLQSRPAEAGAAPQLHTPEARARRAKKKRKPIVIKRPTTK